MHFRNISITSTAIAALTAGAVVAEPAALRPADEWQMDLTWWIFAPISTTGTSTVAGESAEIDMNLSDALDVLDFTSSLRFEAWKDNLGIIVDGNYLGIGDEESITLGGPLGAGLDVDVEAQQSWFSLMLGYRVAQGTTANGQAYAFDIAGGARYNRINQDVTITTPRGTQSLGGAETWWEPVIGARYVQSINETWSMAAGADFSGFGSGGNELAWSATVAFDWSFSEKGSLKIGYRYYDIDFETDRPDGTFGWQIKQHGPFIGVTFALN